MKKSGIFRSFLFVEIFGFAVFGIGDLADAEDFLRAGRVLQPPFVQEQNLMGKGKGIVEVMQYRQDRFALLGQPPQKG